MNTPRRAAAALAGLLLAATGLTATTPAHAAENGSRASTPECIRYDGGGIYDVKRTCLIVWWDPQADGTGIRLEYMEVSTPEGCAQMDPVAFWKTNAVLKSPDYTKTYGSWSWGDEPTCNWSKDFEDPSQTVGKDIGSSIFRFKTCAGDENLLIWEIQLWANDYTWLESSHEDGTAYCT